MRELDFVEKLVVPVLTAILFGVGASEHAAAETNRNNVELAAQGLPPVWGESEMDARITVLNSDDIPSETEIFLLSSIQDLYKHVGELTIEDTDNENRLAGERELLLEKIEKTYTSLSNQNNRTIEGSDEFREILVTQLIEDNRARDNMFAKLEASDEEFEEAFRLMSLSQQYELCRLAMAIDRLGEIESENERARQFRDAITRSRNFGARFRDFFKGQDVGGPDSDRNKTNPFKQDYLARVNDTCELPR